MVQLKKKKEEKNGVRRRPMVKSLRREIQLDICVYVYIHAYKKKKKEEKKRGPMRERTLSFMKKEKKRKRCSSFLLCAPSSTSKKPFLNLPLLYKKRKERTRNLACTRTKRGKKRMEARERKSDHKNKRERGHDDEQKHTRHS
jgi:hypothetical protein